MKIVQRNNSGKHKIKKKQVNCAVLEITVGHWPFSDDQNPFWLANFTVHFQWDGNQ